MLLKHVQDKLLQKLGLIEYGCLTLTTPDGNKYVFEGKQEGQKANLILHDWRVVSHLISQGDIAFAEDYRDGRLDSDDLAALTILAIENWHIMEHFLMGNVISRFRALFSYLFRLNSLQGSRKNISAHYDLGNEFYQLWLDPSMTYSSAIYDNHTPKGNDALLRAQNRKYDRILDQLNQNHGRILEIGCGWGGFGERAAHHGDYDIRGITLSKEQHDYAQNRLGKDAKIRLEDYRHQQGKFDHIVSIEMFEAVGERYWKTYFSKIRELLVPNGQAVIQTITMNEQDFPRYRRSGDFIRSFIFPGGMLPSQSRFCEVAQAAGLKTQSPFSFGQDYAHTLAQWLENFDRQKSAIMALGLDEKFIRLWRFYLAACQAGFHTKRTDVMQIMLRPI